jgi:hypothetical protein
MKISLLFIALCLTQILYSQININTNTIWDGNDPSNPPPSLITGDITISAGYSLTIRNWSMTMPHNSMILVNRNAKLIIEDVTIDAVNNAWKGITCNNGSSPILTTDRVPNVKIMNSTITDADLAFSNNYTVGSNTYYGGAIVAWGTTFK